MMLKRTVSDRVVATVVAAWESAGRGPLLTAVSGGADSTALLLACRMAGIPFEAAHCNFNLRGEESLRDQRFVESLCREYDLKLHLADFDTGKLSLQGESVEMTCRRLRYDFFRQLKERYGFSRITLAHNREDNMETFFLNALRGCGTRGLSGMKTDTGILLRPLLAFSRSEIIEFLEENDRSFIVDSSNLESDYRRNFLRNEVFPMLESRWEGFRKALSNTIELLNRENRIVEHYISKPLSGTPKLLSWSVIDEFPDPETLIFRFISPFGGSSVTASEMNESSKKRVPGKRWQLSNGNLALFTKKGIQIENLSEDSCHENDDEYRWVKLKNSPENMNSVLKASLEEVYLPYGEERYEWVPANREMKIKSLGLKGSTGVFKLLKEAGIPAHNRDKVKVLIEKESGEPVWIPGVKRSKLHLITEEMEEIYRVTK